jgi:parallel beta-helix repeat protein
MNGRTKFGIRLRSAALVAGPMIVVAGLLSVGTVAAHGWHHYPRPSPTPTTTSAPTPTPTPTPTATPTPTPTPTPTATPTPTTLWVNGSGTATPPAGTSCSDPGYSTISSAVAAATSGDTIMVCPGTYNEAPAVTTSDLTIQATNPPWTWSGSSGACTASMSPPTSATIITPPTGYPDGLILSGNGITFRGFWVEGNSGGPGVTTYASDGYSGYRIQDDVFYNSVFGLYFNSGGTTQSKVQGNCFSDNDTGGSASGNGIYEDQGLSNAVISGNHFVDNSNSAIVIVGPNPPSNTVASNIDVSWNTSSGDGSLIAIFGTIGSTVSRNTVQNDTGAAVFFGTDTGLSIEKNVISGSGEGVYACGTNDTDVGAACTTAPNSNVDISGNELYHDGGSAPGGAVYVSLGSLTGSLITDNHAYGSSGDGIYLDSGGNTISGNRVLASSIYDCQDITTGSGTSGTDNTWHDNQGKTSNPYGLCRPLHRFHRHP